MHMILRLAIAFTAVMVLAVAATPSASSANNGAGTGIAPTAVGVAAGQDALPLAGATGLTPAGLQMMDGDHDGWWSNGWWIVMPIMMVIFWGAVLAVAVWGIRQFTRDRGGGPTPLDIARERLARGEISKEEFEQLRANLAWGHHH